MSYLCSAYVDKSVQRTHMQLKRILYETTATNPRGPIISCRREISFGIFNFHYLFGYGKKRKYLYRLTFVAEDAKRHEWTHVKNKFFFARIINSEKLGNKRKSLVHTLFRNWRPYSQQCAVTFPVPSQCWVMPFTNTQFCCASFMEVRSVGLEARKICARLILHAFAMYSQFNWFTFCRK